MTEIDEKYWLNFNEKDASTNTEKNKKFYKIFLLLVVFLLVLVGFGVYLKSKINSNILEYTESENAIVTNIRVRYVKVNDMDGSYVLNHTVSYEFIHEHKKIKGMQIIDSYLYDDYFEEKLKINDTIAILFNPKQPAQSKIKKIKF